MIKAIIILALLFIACPCYASPWNRHDELTKAIGDARKSKQLSRKEAAKLRRSLSRILKLKEEMKEHNVREFTSDDMDRLAAEYEQVSTEFRRLVSQHSKQADKQ